jgi:hypothetical protein
MAIHGTNGGGGLSGGLGAWAHDKRVGVVSRGDLVTATIVSRSEGVTLHRSPTAED